MKKVSDVIDNYVVKNTKFNTLKTKVNSLEKKIPDATTLIHINQCNTDKQNLQKKSGDVDKIIPGTSVYWLQMFWIQKLVKFRIKFQIMINILLLPNFISYQHNVLQQD